MSEQILENPVCVSLLICDDVYQDIRTRKQVIVGTFNRINCEALPHHHPRLVVVFAITDTRSAVDLALSIEHEESGDPLVDVKGPFNSTDPLAIHDLVIELGNIEFQFEGKHWVMVKSNGEIIGQRPFWVVRGSDSEAHLPEQQP